MGKYWILCSLLLLSLMPLSCSQKECEWRRDVANFQPEESVVLSQGYSDQTEAFSVKGEKMAIRWAAASYPNGGRESHFSIDVYRYPDMELVASPVDETEVGEEAVMERVEVQAENGTYCLYISSSVGVAWAIAVEEWVCS